MKESDKVNKKQAVENLKEIKSISINGDKNIVIQDINNSRIDFNLTDDEYINKLKKLNKDQLNSIRILLNNLITLKKKIIHTLPKKLIFLVIFLFYNYLIIANYTTLKLLIHDICSKPPHKIEVPKMIKIYNGEYSVGMGEQDISEQNKLFNNPLSFYAEFSPKVYNVYIDSFYIGQYETSVRQYNEYLKFFQKDTLKENPNYPVTNITWYDAMQYCDWLSTLTNEKYRLPYEIEWEISSKGLSNSIFPWGNDIPNHINCNFKDNNINAVIEIDRIPYNQSVFDVYNMSGNVAEWCLDWYHEDYYNILKNFIYRGRMQDLPQNSEEKVIRGGSYKDISFDVRCTSRKKANPELHENHIGFRIVKVCQTKNQGEKL